jgi:hypothetical protein
MGSRENFRLANWRAKGRLGKYHRLSKDYEKLSETSETFIYT